MLANQLTDAIDSQPHGWEWVDISVRPYGFLDSTGGLERRDEALAEATCVLAPHGGHVAGGVVHVRVGSEPALSNSAISDGFALRQPDGKRMAGDVYAAEKAVAA